MNADKFLVLPSATEETKRPYAKEKVCTYKPHDSEQDQLYAASKVDNAKHNEVRVCCSGLTPVPKHEHTV